ncbi:MAG: ankyrin repeat domain-containing protein [Albidovulum sp.]|nr:ankyrin repeat domain-containing protein [Albidovulum sp.]
MTIDEHPEAGRHKLTLELFQLFGAVRRDDINRIEALITAGADINGATPGTGYTPLMWATSAEATRTLLHAGASVHARNREGLTSLMWAISRNNVPDEAALIANELIDAGADVEARDNNGQTPLNWARRHRDRSREPRLRQIAEELVSVLQATADTCSASPELRARGASSMQCKSRRDIRPLPVFVINLDRRPDRWEAMSAQMNRLGIEATRIAAIDKHRLRIDDPALDRLGDGHVACLHSHCKAMEAFLDTDAAAALIMEDDVEIGAELPDLIADLSWWPPDHDLVKVQSPINETLIWLDKPVGSTPTGRSLRPIRLSALGAYGYLVGRETAWGIKALRPSNLHMPIDHLLFDLKNSRLARRSRPLQMTPGVIRHLPFERFGSETGVGAINGKELWKPSRAIRVYNRIHWLKGVVTGSARKVSVSYRSIMEESGDRS